MVAKHWTYLNLRYLLVTPSEADKDDLIEALRKTNAAMQAESLLDKEKIESLQRQIPQSQLQVVRW